MSRNRSQGIAPWLIAQFVILAAATGGMFWLRGVVLDQQQTPQAAQEWTEWRQDVQEHGGVLGPVKRRVPQSTEPPALVLMRDHYVACLVAVVVGTALTSGVTFWFLRGALRGG